LGLNRLQRDQYVFQILADVQGAKSNISKLLHILRVVPQEVFVDIAMSEESKDITKKVYAFSKSLDLSKKEANEFRKEFRELAKEFGTIASADMDTSVRAMKKLDNTMEDLSYRFKTSKDDFRTFGLAPIGNEVDILGDQTTSLSEKIRGLGDSFASNVAKIFSFGKGAKDTKEGMEELSVGIKKNEEAMKRYTAIMSGTRKLGMKSEGTGLIDPSTIDGTIERLRELFEVAKNIRTHLVEYYRKGVILDSDKENVEILLSQFSKLQQYRQEMSERGKVSELFPEESTEQIKEAQKAMAQVNAIINGVSFAAKGLAEDLQYPLEGMRNLKEESEAIKPIEFDLSEIKGYSEYLKHMLQVAKDAGAALRDLYRKEQLGIITDDELRQAEDLLVLMNNVSGERKKLTEEGKVGEIFPDAHVNSVRAVEKLFRQISGTILSTVTVSERF